MQDKNKCVKHDSVFVNQLQNASTGVYGDKHVSCVCRISLLHGEKYESIQQVGGGEVM